MAKLSKEERELKAAVERGEWRSARNVKAETKRLQRYADATFKKNRRVNIRISDKDLEALQKRAIEEGIPYQTLIASVLHKYVSGRLVEKAA